MVASQADLEADVSAGAAHRLALLQEGESKLSPKHLEVWRQIMELLPKDSPLVGDRGGWGLEMFLMKHIARGATLEDLRRYVPKIAPRYVDRRLAASGERA